MGHDSAVGIATGYGTGGQGIESQWMQDVPHPSRHGSLLYSRNRDSFPGVKPPGHGVDHTPPSSAEVKKTVELYLYPPSGSSWPVIV
jgi:hypothetical protein